MWTVTHTPLIRYPGERSVIHAQGKALPFDEVLAGWSADAAFRDFFLADLATGTHGAIFWETPAIAHGNLDRTYEHVVIRAPSLERLVPDMDAFERVFAGDASSSTVVTFPNLGRDAILVAPKPVAAAEAYSHLAAFLQGAPSHQHHALVQAVAAAARDVLARRKGPLWISTSGLGVAWLHVRLDTVPKYYNFEPYTRA